MKKKSDIVWHTNDNNYWNYSWRVSSLAVLEVDKQF